ncbi:16S rRNA (adenine1518-N6/adenine1519-N6)-dimethyltransferase [Rhodobium orientis]|uniref:Ribosomal RNA small subunit methyltransferase A n=1 Tax=Rhodobium orientis TaxID=34017 RepID=A0A327JQB5_9HYPH|nr:16S rRNA (adenine(1518)-N(6)/adenine(1519)-N(6))-dimethyltransferase RsmA [Rhodobium orientis]MBB4302212.1 16S rRNA (adenine1518-N6/adenine1519-N6)-dimethyltransferase [Rhodobium orientis]MBK5948923.1 16S rRNA (adenine(1518)-N(6)/adenine(1519)-N(6))-dimethyltransferase [Rhodobium orientis]RAI27895.1 16S rRNA (adenine(1518)-N(6)/adenine(1519)-N(6))-dimethyltransferase [Rhodobium orientis]
MGQIDDLPPLREVIRTHDLGAKKSLGQNFLLDLNLTARIARAAGPLEDVTAVEVGPGPGGLTRALLAAGAKRVLAVERDERCLPALADIASAYPGRLQVLAEDALKVDWQAHLGGPAVLVANLPYNIATPLLIGWLQDETWPPFWRCATLMFQREVAERIVAPPGSRTFGRLSVMAGWRTEARLLFDIPARAFTPPPKVVSSVVHLVPRTDAANISPKLLERVTAAAFGQRRKMLRSSLKSLAPDAADLIAAAGLDPTARAEDISVAGFIDLARTLEKKGSVALNTPSP